jgi:hypothetical protein
MHPTRIFKSPEELRDAFEEYKKHLKAKSLEWPKIQYVGKDGNRVEDYPKLPMTMEGFSVFCFDRYGTVKHYFDNKEGYYDDFGVICSRIKEEIRDDQITGGLLGEYNASITQRLNGLADKRENEHSGKVDVITGMRIVNGTDV